jgi:DNA gyrase/topoisomerase IV subunit A
MGLTIADLHQLAEYEIIGTLCRWAEVRDKEKLLLVTTLGFARPYPMDVLKVNIEAPVPLRFDRPLPGNPVVALGTQADEALIMVTRAARAVRFGLDSLRLAGLQAINCGRDDRVIGALLARPEDEVLLLTADGYAGRLLAGWIPAPAKANTKGKVMIARRSDVAALTRLSSNQPLWLATSQRLVRAEYTHLPLSDSTKTARLLKLQPNETLQTILYPRPSDQ